MALQEAPKIGAINTGCPSRMGHYPVGVSHDLLEVQFLACRHRRALRCDEWRQVDVSAT